MARKKEMKLFSIAVILVVLIDEGSSIECYNGIKTHEKSKHKAKYEKCGIANKAEVKPCPAESHKSCSVVDVWLKTIDDLPMSIHMCGPNKKSTFTCENNERECKPSCKKESIESYKKELEKFLTKHVDPKKLSKECLNWLTDIHALTQSSCSDKDGCNDCYCPNTKVSPADKKCQTAPPATTIASNPKTDPSSATTVASNKTGNATTSGTTKLTNELISIAYLAFMFLISLLF